MNLAARLAMARLRSALNAPREARRRAPLRRAMARRNAGTIKDEGNSVYTFLLTLPTQPRYRLPPGFAKSEVLFNLHRAASTGGGSVHQAGIQSVVSLMGAVVYDPQCHALVARFPRVILMLDGDITGRRATKMIAAKLRPSCLVHVIELPDGVQPDQLSTREIRQILAHSNDD